MQISDSDGQHAKGEPLADPASKLPWPRLLSVLVMQAAGSKTKVHVLFVCLGESYPSSQSRKYDILIETMLCGKSCVLRRQHMQEPYSRGSVQKCGGAGQPAGPDCD